MDAIAPGIAKRLDLLGLARDVLLLAVLHVAAGGAPLKIAVEFDAVGRVEVDALHLAAQGLALGQAGHDLQAVAQDHAVGPVLVMLVELGLVHALGDAVEVGKQVGGGLPGLVLALLAGAQQVVDQRLGVDFFLDVERRRVDDQLAPVLLVLAAPDQLRVQVGVARVAHLPGGDVLLRGNGLLLDRGDVLAPGLVVGEGFDVFGAELGGHGKWGVCVGGRSDAGQRKPMGGLALRVLSSAMSCLMASNTCENCSS